MNRFFTSLTGNTLLKVGVGVTLIIALASGVSYYLIFREIEHRVQQQISLYTVQRGQREQAIFLLAQDSQQVIKRTLLDNLRLGDYEQPEALKRFDDLFMRYPDGAVRSRPEYATGENPVTGWIHKDVELTPELRRRMALFHDLIQQFKPSILIRFSDLFFTAPEQLNIGTDPPGMPLWVMNTPADFDQNQEEWVYAADPAHNPARKTVWTGVYLDPVWQSFLVAVATPIDDNGRHIATITYEILLEELIQSLLKSGITGALHGVFQADGRLIAYTDRMDDIRASKGHYFIQHSGDPRLQALFKAVQGKTDFPVSGYDPIADYYFSVSRLEGPDWYFASIMPGRLVRGEAFKASQWVLWTGLVSLVLVLAVLAVLLRRQIALPLQRLVSATRQVGDRNALVSLDTERSDELGELATAFVENARTLAEEFRERALALQVEIEERQRAYAALRQSEARYELVAQQTGQILYDGSLASGDIHWVGRIEQLTGYSRAEFQQVGIQEWKQLVHPEDQGSVLAELRRHQAELSKFRVEYRLRHKDGRYIYIEDEGVFIADEPPESVRVLGTLKDISERKRAEELQREAKEEADRANRAKSQFLANMSHELRTPLNAILGYTQILLRNPSLRDKERRHVAIIHQSGHHLLGLINDILDLVKIESSRLEVNTHDFRLADFLSSIASVFMIRARQKQLAFRQVTEPGLPDWVHSDEQKLRQILFNLISNAVKFTNEGEVVFTVNRQDGQICFTVQDTGCGINPDDLNQLFQPFIRGRNVANRIEGTGLGLAISHSMVELLGGVLQVESTLDKGSRFWFSLPLPAVAAPAPAGDKAEPRVTGYQGPRRRVLVADDWPENRSVLVDMLAPLGFDLLEAQDGQTAIEHALAWKPDVILMDVRMPVLDGLEATRRIRTIPELKGIVVIAISASAYEQNREQCLAAGVDDFLAKPFREENLLELLRIHLSLELTADAIPAATAGTA